MVGRKRGGYGRAGIGVTMKTTEQYFQEFYNEIRYQIEQGEKADFTRANQIWSEYERAKGSTQHEHNYNNGLYCPSCGKPLF